MRPAEVRPAEVRPAEVRPAEVRLDEGRLAEVRFPEVRRVEVCPAEGRAPLRSAPLRSAPLRSGRECWTGFSTLQSVPDIDALLEELEMLCIGHWLRLHINDPKRGRADFDRHGSAPLLAPLGRKRGSVSGCDARRLSTGRSIRA